MAEEPAPPTPSLNVSAAQPYQAGPGGSSSPGKSGDGSGWILALACMQAAWAIIYFALNISDRAEVNAVVSLVVMLVLAAIYFGLWFWAKKALFPALLTTLIVFVTVHLLDAVVDPTSIYRGIIIKVLAVAGLGSALKKAYVAKRERELEAAGS